MKKPETNTGRLLLVPDAKESDREVAQSVKSKSESHAMTFQRPAPHATAPMVPSEHVVLNFNF